MKKVVNAKTGPAVRQTLRQMDNLRVANSMAHSVPTPEYGAQLAIAAAQIVLSCIDICESMGLRLIDVMDASSKDPLVFQKKVEELLRNKEKMK